MITSSFATIVVIMLPFILPGTLGVISSEVLDSLREYQRVSMNAFNFWFPLGYAQVDYRQPIVDFRYSLPDSTRILGVQLETIGLIIFAAYTLLVLYQVHKDRANILLGSSSLAFAFFMLPTEIHERYLFPFFALFAVPALEERRYLLCYVVLTATCFLNMLVVFTAADTRSFFYFVYSTIGAAVGYSYYTVGVMISIINAAVFLYFSRFGIFRSLGSNLRQDFTQIKAIRRRELRVELPASTQPLICSNSAFHVRPLQIAEKEFFMWRQTAARQLNYTLLRICNLSLGGDSRLASSSKPTAALLARFHAMITAILRRYPSRGPRRFHFVVTMDWIKP